MSKRKAKKKPTRAEKHAEAMVKFGIVKEASASVSLDGDTKHCEACLVEGWLARDVSDFKKNRGVDAKDRVFDSAIVWAARPEHVCGLRPITAAERELVEAALRRDMFAVMDATEKVRAERKEKR